MHGIRTTQILVEYTENMIIRRDMYKKFHLSQTRKRTSEHNFYRTHMSLAMKRMTLNHWLQPEQRNALKKCYEQHNYIYHKLHWEWTNWTGFFYLEMEILSENRRLTNVGFIYHLYLFCFGFLVYLFHSHINLSKPAKTNSN